MDKYNTMPAISKSKNDYEQFYTGFERVDVGLGTVEPNIYATKKYKKKKTDKILIGGMQEILYTGMEHDLRPLIIVIGYEPAYNTILGFNLNYIPKPYRYALINYILRSNHARIKGQKPLIVDYRKITKKIPELSAIVRRYKVNGIKILNQYPLVEWTKEAKRKSKWEKWYKSNQNKSAFKTKGGVFKKLKKKV